MRGGRKQQDIDDFINNELGEIQDQTPAPVSAKPAMGKPTGSIGSKPAFAMGGKKPGSIGSKPNFAIKKKPQQQVDDLIESELTAIEQTNPDTYTSPDKNQMRPPSTSQSAYKDNAAGDQSQGQGEGEDDMNAPNTTPLPDRKDLSVSKIKKGPTMFMKPKLPTKKKFQMAEPDAAEQEKFDKLTVQQIKAAELTRDHQSSALKKKIDDNVVAPIALVKKTQAAVQFQKFNPRPPQEALNKKKDASESEDYSDGGGFDAEEADDEAKLSKIRQQIAKENAKVAAKVESGKVGQGPTKMVVKSQGPKAMNVQKGAIQRSNIQKVNEEEDFIPEDTPQTKKIHKVVKNVNPLKNGGLPIVGKLKTLGGGVGNVLPTVKKQEGGQQPSFLQRNQAPMSPGYQGYQQAAPGPAPTAQAQLQQQTFDYADPSQPRRKVEADKNLESFTKQTVLIAGERVDHMAADRQKVRATELKELLQLDQEEFFNVFEMVPQTAQDIYFQKLSSGVVKTAIVSSEDDLVDKDMQTEDLGAEDKFNQAPDDQVGQAYENNAQGGGGGVKITQKRSKNEALQLEKFMNRAGPVIEQLLDENTQLHFMDNRHKAAKRNAVESREKLCFPSELLYLLGSQMKDASVERVTCVHIFETNPQSKCAIAYNVLTPRHDLIHIVVVFNTTANQSLRFLRAESEVTQMCTPADDQILIVGTEVGSLCLFDLTDFESQVGADFLDFKNLIAKSTPELMVDGDHHKVDKQIKQLTTKYKVLTHTFQTDALPNYQHFSPIRRLKFVSKNGQSPAQIGAIDELGVVSSWSVMEIAAHHADKISDFDLNLNIGGRFKLLENYSENLMYMPDIFKMDEFHDVAMALELEFDPTDHNIFYFSTTEALFKCNRRDSNVPVRLASDGLGAPTALSMSDNGYLLVGFTCGSIALYHNKYLSPLTVWYQASQYPIMQISWCLLYFSSLDSTVRNERQFMTRMCEFFVIDKAENFLIFNLSKNLNKPAHSINFADKHSSALNSSDLYRISMTCADQTFYTTFLLRDLSVQLYMMNFKKGSQITKEKLGLENAKSNNLLKTLPLNMEKEDQIHNI